MRAATMELPFPTGEIQETEANEAPGTYVVVYRDSEFRGDRTAVVYALNKAKSEEKFAEFRRGLKYRRDFSIGPEILTQREFAEYKTFYFLFYAGNYQNFCPIIAQNEDTARQKFNQRFLDKQVQVSRIMNKQEWRSWMLSQQKNRP